VTPRKVGILGPGAIGGLLAARLSKAGHEVTMIATARTAVAITLTGLTLYPCHEQLETRPIARPWLPLRSRCRAATRGRMAPLR
jgi:2-dehydropantoate 2-reductase